MSKTDRNEIEEHRTGELGDDGEEQDGDMLYDAWRDAQDEPRACLMDGSDCGSSLCPTVTFAAAQARLARVLNRMAERLEAHLEKGEIQP